MKTFFLFLTSLVLVGAGCIGGNSVTPSTVAGVKTLDLHGQDLTTLDQSIFSESSLEFLDVSDNQLTGALPAEIRKLSALQTLDASDNFMTGVPAEIGQLSHLEQLDLSNNKLTGLPNELGNLTNLRMLDLRGNEISEIDVNILRQALPSTNIYL